MKIAVCFIGMIRTGVQASENIKNYFKSYYNDIDFFMHTWDRSEPKPWHKDSSHVVNKLSFQNLTPTSSQSLINQLKRKYDDKFISIVSEDQLKLFSTKLWQSYTNFSPQWYSWYKVLKLVRSYEEQKSFKYDIVVKLRPDIIRPPELNFREEVLHMMKDKTRLYTLAYDPRRIDDVMFLSDSDIMYRASKFFIETSKTRWETNIVGEWFRSNSIVAANTANSKYTIYREEAIKRHISPMQFDKCVTVDLEYYSQNNLAEFNRITNENTLC